MRSPHVALLVMDAARSDVVTPRLAEHLADDRFVVYERAVSPASWTPVSFASMLTGLLPHDHQVVTGAIYAGGTDRTFAGAEAGPYSELRHTWLPTRLQEAGYRLVGASKSPWLSNSSGFGSQFDDYEQFLDWTDGGSPTINRRQSRRERLQASALGRQALRLYQRYRSRQLAQADVGARDALEYLGDRVPAAHDDPVFMFTNLLETHAPYRPPRPYDRHLRRAGVSRAKAFTIPLDQWQAFSGADHHTDETRAAIRAMYRGCAEYAADLVAAFARRLVDAGFCVVVTSDHGEELFENGVLGHGFSTRPEAVHVPFAVGHPDLAGRVDPDVVSTISAFDVISVAAGLRDGDLLPASSQPVISEKEDRSAEAVLRLKGRVPERLRLGVSPELLWIADPWKLHGTAGGWAASLLAGDLHGTPVDLGDAPEHVRDAAAALQSALDALGDSFEPLDVTASAATETTDEDDEIRRRMAQLGYL